jgi:metal-responsive CopG/Arc/MetJ family transcriptional regulator
MQQDLSRLDKGTNVRTQITLPKRLKALIEKRAGQKQQSLSEYLRQASWQLLTQEEQNEKELGALADQAIGSVDLKKHPEWQKEI